MARGLRSQHDGDTANHELRDAGAAGLTLERYAADLNLPVDWLSEVGLSTIQNPATGKSAVAIRYRRRDGSPFRDRIRQATVPGKPRESKSFWDARPDKFGGLLYGLERLPSIGSQLILVTDEAPCHVLWHHGFDAVATQGEDGYVKRRDDPELAGFDVVLFGAGDALRGKLLGSEHRGHMRVATLDEFPDLLQLHRRAPDRFAAIVNGAIEAATPLTRQALPEDASARPRSGGSGEGTIVDTLVGLAEEGAVFFATEEGTTWADVEVEAHRATYPLWSTSFRQWLTHVYYKRTRRAPARDAFHQALATLDAVARFDGQKRAIHVRTGRLDDRYYLDLGDADWCAVEIDATGWRLVNDPPIRFHRPRGMLPLPMPVRGGELRELRQYLNVACESDWLLIVSWLLAALRPTGPYPLLAITGEPGASKSTMARVLRDLIDPNTAALRSAPREERECWIQASNAAMLAFDNLSAIPGWLSDTLCQIATGGGFAVRQIQTDTDEIIFNAVRPTLLTSIGEVITRSDLASRTIMIDLPAIPEESRMLHEDFRAAFEEARPRILGALLDAMVVGMRNRREVSRQRLPRLADFAFWATACEPAFAQPGAVIEAFEENLQTSARFILENDSICIALQKFVRQSGKEEQPGIVWEGPAEELLAQLELHAHNTGNNTGWPKNPQALSGKLGMVARELEQIGLKIVRGRTRESRYIRIVNTPAARRQRQR